MVVDVAVDQGGCIETIRPTTHADPTYLVHDVIHYGVAKHAGRGAADVDDGAHQPTLPYVERIAELGVDEAVRRTRSLAFGANVWHGKVVCEGVADALGLDYTPVEEVL